MSDIRFGYTIIYVPDPVKSIAFYTEAFGLAAGFVSEDGEYAELQTGETTLSFAAESLGDAHFEHGFLRHSMANPPLGTEIALTTSDVEATMQRAIEAGGHMLVPAEVKPWGQTVGWIRDPYGVLIEICTPIG